MKKIICMICSKEKREGKDLLPAYDRYLGEHISLAKKQAEKEGMDFYIFSGKYGLLAAYEKITNYDYFLAEDNIDSIAVKMAGQLTKEEIGEIDFYTKKKWVTYHQAMEKACETAGVKINVFEIGD
jgi:hypothetical protein